MIEINLLPKEFQKKGLSISFDKTMMYLLGGAAVLIILMIAVSFYQGIQLGNIEGKIQIAQAKADAYKDEIAQIDNLNALKDQILSRISAIDVLDKNRIYWVTLLSDLTVRVPSHVWLTGFTQDGTVEKQQLGKSKGKVIGEPSADRTILEGYTFSLNALAAFIIQLNKSEYFDDLDISSIKLEEVEEKALYNFKINCILATTTAREELKEKKGA